MDDYHDYPEIQQTIAFSLAVIQKRPPTWINLVDFTEGLLLPALAESIINGKEHYELSTLCDARILRCLCRFGLLEKEHNKDERYKVSGKCYRKTPLFDKFVRVEFG